MKLVIHPPVEPERYEKICSAAPSLTIVNASCEDEARVAVADADAFFGKLTPRCWPQPAGSAGCSLRRPAWSIMSFPELIEHSLRAHQHARPVLGRHCRPRSTATSFAFARNLHRYIRNQLEARWEPVGGRGGAAAVLDRAGHREQHRPGPPPPGRGDARHRRSGPIGSEICAPRRGIRNAGAGGRCGPDPASRRSRRALACGASRRPAGRERLRRDRGAPHAGDRGYVPLGRSSGR